MPKSYFPLLIFLLTSICFKAQNDSVLVPPDIQDGIYLTYEDFRLNRPLTREDIESKLDKEQQEFIGKVMFENTLTYRINGQLLSAETKTVWGYFQNNTLYVNFRGEFFRVPVFGSVCYFVATVTVINSGFYDPTFGYGAASTRTKEIREFMMNFYDGVVLEFNLDNVEQLLSRDATLFAEYKKLSKRKRKDQIYGYIRKFNEAHPVYFLR